MIPVDDPFLGRPAGVQPGRGGFMRDSRDVPYISDPTGATVKSGARKGEPKRVRYASTSGFGRQIENPTNLIKWAERKIVEGLAVDGLELLFDHWRHEVDDKVRNDIADRIVRTAKEAADANKAADVGTHVHLLLELADNGQTIVDVLADGVALGLTNQQQADIVTAWRDTLAVYGLEVVAVERSVVDDVWRCAGTLDRHLRCTRTITVGDVVIPAGTVVVADIKTGRLRHVAAIQVASYAQSHPYDTATETRGVWPYDVSQQHGLIVAVDVADAAVHLHHVDLVAGREHGGACVVAARAWEARDDLFTKIVSAAEPAANPPTAADTPSVVIPEPDEGPTAADSIIDGLGKAWKLLPATGQAWMNRIKAEAAEAGVPISPTETPTLRRARITDGLVVLAHEGACDDDLLRAILLEVFGDTAMFATVTVGALVGSMSVTEASLFAAVCDRFVNDRYRLVFDDHGTARLRAA